MFFLFFIITFLRFNLSNMLYIDKNINTVLIIKVTDFGNFYKVLNTLGLFVLPSLSKNMLLTFLTTKSSYKPCLIYRYLMEIPKSVTLIISTVSIKVKTIEESTSNHLLSLI